MSAVVEKKLGNHLQVAQLIDDCIEKYPTCVDAYIFKAQSLYERSKYKSAIEVYQNCDASLLVHMGRGDCQRKLRKYADSISEYSKGLKLEQGS
jgi:tetratricopeptide (TPR) repeat protein